jgi:hypothetical protein
MAATGDGDSDVNLHRAAAASDDVEQSHEQQECKVLSFLWEVEVVEGENGGEREGAERMPMLISSEVGFTVVDWARSPARGRAVALHWWRGAVLLRVQSVGKVFGAKLASGARRERQAWRRRVLLRRVRQNARDLSSSRACRVVQGSGSLLGVGVLALLSFGARCLWSQRRGRGAGDVDVRARRRARQ